jgi:hydrogenase nickel incorporation protein HypB
MKCVKCANMRKRKQRSLTSAPTSQTLPIPLRGTAAKEIEKEDLDFLFIENVGNLVCPSGFDLGENLRLVLVSTTEGEDKPLKYPTIFNTADVAAVTKLDLAAAVEFDLEALIRNVHGVRPGMPILKVSTRTGQGVEEVKELLLSQLTEFETAVAD